MGRRGFEDGVGILIRNLARKSTHIVQGATGMYKSGQCEHLPKPRIVY